MVIELGIDSFLIIRLFAWDNEQIVLSWVLLSLIAISNMVSTFFMARNLASNGNSLKKYWPMLYWTYVILSLNGPAIYTTWTIIAALVNFDHALVYSWDASMFTR